VNPKHLNSEIMKKYFLLLFAALFISGNCFSQDKVIDRSGKKPKWVNGLEKDYIITVGSDITIQNAQKKALSMVKESIVSSVAENVKSVSKLKSQETNINNRIFNFLQRFTTQTTTESTKVPFLQGISLSLVNDFYWEKMRRKDKSTYFNYYIKYPFSSSKLLKLVQEFKQRDKEFTGHLQNLISQSDSVKSIEQIEKNINELKILQGYFIDNRKEMAELGISNYLSLLGSVELVELDNEPGLLKYALKLGTKIISTIKKPMIKSACARITSFTNHTNYFLVKYDFGNCYEDPENNLTIKYRFGNTVIQKKFYFDISANKTSIFVTDTFHFLSVSKGENKVNASVLDLIVISKYDSPFTIEKVVINFKGLTPVIINEINQSFSGKGVHNLKLKINQPINIDESSSSRKTLSMLSGYIYYKSNISGEIKSYRIYNQSYTTDW